MADDVLLENDLPAIPPGVPTRDSLLAEANALGMKFVEVTVPPYALLADADEMIAGREDLPAFTAAGFPVEAHHFTRLELLAKELAPRSAARERHGELRRAYTAKAEARRNELVKFQRRMKRRARAARLPASLFSLGRINTRKLGAVLWRVEEIAHHTQDQLARFAQQDVVAKLAADALTLVDAIKAERRQLGLMSAEGVGETRLQQQLERLLFDTMRFVGAQGLALFDDDATRDARYRLDHVYGHRNVAAASDDDVEPELPPVPPEGAEA